MRKITLLDTNLGGKIEAGIVSDNTARRICSLWGLLDSNNDLAILSEKSDNKLGQSLFRIVISNGMRVESFVASLEAAKAFDRALGMEYIPSRGVKVQKCWEKLGRVCTMYSISTPEMRAMRMHRNIASHECSCIKWDRI